MSTTRVLAYKTAAEAQRAADYLVNQGVPQSDISVLMNDKTHGAHFQIEEKTKSNEGAGVGAVVGGVLGALGATAAAIAGIAIPGVGFLAAGPIMTALAGAGAGGAVGGLAGGLAGLGVAEHEAKFYEELVTEGGVLLGVSVPDDNRSKLIHKLEEHTAPARVTTS